MPRNTLTRPLREPVLDHLVQASVDASGGGFTADGHYGHLVYAGCASAERAREIRQALFRAAKRMGYSMSATAARGGDGEWEVRFFAVDKNAAREYVLRTYGPDRENWPYSPVKGDKNYDA